MDPKQVNVLDLPKRPGYKEIPIEHLARPVAPTISDVAENEIEDERNGSSTIRRIKRQAPGVVILPEAITDNEGRTRHVVTMVTRQRPLFYSINGSFISMKSILKGLRPGLCQVLHVPLQHS